MKKITAIFLGTLLMISTSAIGAEWQSLFDGKTLNDWRASDEPGTFSVNRCTCAAGSAAGSTSSVGTPMSGVFSR